MSGTFTCKFEDEIVTILSLFGSNRTIKSKTGLDSDDFKPKEKVVFGLVQEKLTFTCKSEYPI